MTRPQVCKVLRRARPLGVAGFASGDVGALLRTPCVQIRQQMRVLARLRLRFELAACKTLATALQC